MMNHPSARRHSSPTLEPEDRFIRILREMDQNGEMTKEIDRVELEVEQSRQTVGRRNLRRRYKSKRLPKQGK